MPWSGGGPTPGGGRVHSGGAPPPPPGPVPLAADTSLAAERLQVEAWRRMAPWEKLALLDDMVAGCRALADLGARLRAGTVHPLPAAAPSGPPANAS